MSRNRVIRIAIVAVAAGLGGGWARSVQAKAFTLPELVEMARRGNPGVLAGGAAARAMESQVAEAKRFRLPSGELTSFIAPVPRIECRSAGQQFIASPPGGPPGDQAADCVSTNADPINNTGKLLIPAGAWWRTDLRLIQPILDFGKIAAGVAAAEAGVAALRHKQEGSASEVELNIRKAYWGRKLARELLDALAEGSGYVGDAQKKIDKQLEEGSGNVTVTDKLRLRTVRAEVDARTLEAKRLGQLALTGLRTLIGDSAPADLDIDDEPLEPLDIPERTVGYYQEQARLSRPEVRALEYAVKAKYSLSDLERRKEYPDLVLIGTASYAYAPTIDVPKNAYANNPFNTIGAGISAALRVPLDLGPRLARADRVRSEADEVDLRRREALGGIALEVSKAYGEVTEARDRVAAVRSGERAGKAWVTAVAQNFAIGLAEARDFSDALLAFFTMRARYLQSVYDLNVAAAALSRATGTPVP